MTALLLTGCRSIPLGGYLSCLGLLRTVSRTLDPDATGHWRTGYFVLDSRYSTVDDLASALHGRFEPEPIVSPWNAGSGFVPNRSNVSAAKLLQWVRDSGEPRLAALRQGVAAGDRIVELGIRRGWGGGGDTLWDKVHKQDVLRLCRTEFPDSALPWLDAAATLGQDDPAYSRLLGTGGNFGRQDLSGTYLARVKALMSDPRSPRWLLALLTGDETVPYLRDAVGQFDPGRAGGIQSSPLEKSDDKGFVNPWGFVLTIEGALLFASAVTRRHGAGYSRAALPFQVRGTTSGYDSSAPDETPLGELWAPEWARPAGLAEVAHLLAEGRAEWNGRPAMSALDFVRAVATLGVDRGMTGFQRYVFADRLGRSPLAVPAGRIDVGERAGVALLSGLDNWLDAVRRSSPPASVAVRLRALERALFDHARSGAITDFVAVFAAAGACHEAIARSGIMREKVRPLVLRNGRAILAHLGPAADNDLELRIALALATAQDTRPGLPTMRGLRPLLAPVAGQPPHDRVVGWSSRPLVGLAAGVAAGLAEAARRQAFPDTRVADDEEDEAAVRGARIAFQHGLPLSAADVELFVQEGVDDRRLADLLAGLLTVDWPPDASIGPNSSIATDPALNLLLLFGSVTALTLRGEDGGTRRLVLRPGSQWPVLLAAGRTGEVLADAARRLRIGGLRHVITPTATALPGVRLAAALLLPTHAKDRWTALRRVALLPQVPVATENEEISG